MSNQSGIPCLRDASRCLLDSLEGFRHPCTYRISEDNKGICMEETLVRSSLGMPEKAAAKAVQMKYCLYARKSTEQDELQALSIDSQIREMTQVAERDGLEVVDVRSEKHSAKAAGQRPVYQQLLADVREGKFNGILTWAPDRLSRNGGDLGALVDLMD